jgi:hypothetical protein
VVFDRIQFYLNGAVPEPSSSCLFFVALLLATRIRRQN